jgi:hypothetical protein
MVCDAITLGDPLCPMHRSAAEDFNRHLRGVSKFENIQVSKLTVDYRFQRDLVEDLIKSIVQDFNEYDLGVLTVSRRAHQNVLLDGQQRWTALVRMGFAEAPCEVLESLTLEQETLIFVIRNEKRRAIRRALLFNNKAKAGVEPFQTAVAILEQFGYEVIDTGSRTSVMAGKLSCPSTVEVVHRMGKLAATLLTIHTAWPKQAEPNRAEVLMGIAAFLTINPHIEADDLGFSLSKFQPERLVEQAKAVAKSSIERRLWVHFYEQVVQAWNYSKKTNRVPRIDVSPRAPKMWLI